MSTQRFGDIFIPLIYQVFSSYLLFLGIEGISFLSTLIRSEFKSRSNRPYLSLLSESIKYCSNEIFGLI